MRHRELDQTFSGCSKAFRSTGVTQVNHRATELSAALSLLVIPDLDEMPKRLLWIGEHQKTKGLRTKDPGRDLALQEKHVVFRDANVVDKELAVARCDLDPLYGVTHGLRLTGC